MERIEKSEDIINFIVVLASFIPKRKWNDKEMHMTNLATGEDYGTLKEYFKTQMKELFDIEVEYTE